MTIRFKVQIAFLLAALIAVGGTGWLAFSTAREALETVTFERLTAIRDIRRRDVEAVFQRIAGEMSRAAGDPRLVDLARKWEPPRGLRANDYDELAGLLTEYRKAPGFLQVYLLFPDGTGVSAERTPAPALLPSDSTLIRSVQTRGMSGVSFADFRSIGPGPPAACAYLSPPETQAVLISVFGPDEINAILTSGKNWQQEGLGNTGEVFLVGEDSTMRSESRFFVEDREQYLSRLAEAGEDSASLGRIRRSGTTMLQQHVQSDAAVDALTGRDSTRIAVDYRGIPVLSSYAPVSIPGVRWAILAEIDLDEAMEPVNTLRDRLLLLGVALLAIAAVAGFVFSRTTSRPLLALATAADRLGTGDLTQRVDTGAGGEIGFLAGSFNRMADGLSGAIAERRRAEAELSASRQQLRDLSAHLQSVREEERKSIARDIHDDLGQALTTLKLDLTLRNKELGDAHLSTSRRIAEMSRLVEATIRWVKRIIAALRPRLLDDLGLTAAIEWQAEEFQVMRMLALGGKIRDIAEELTLSEKTITTCRARVLEKMKMRSNADITRYAIRHKLID